MGIIVKDSDYFDKNLNETDQKAAAQVVKDLGDAVRKYKPEFYSKIKNWLKDGYSLSQIYRELEIGHEIMNVWRRKSPALNEMVTQGLEWGQGWFEEQIRNNLDNRNFQLQPLLGYMGKRFRRQYSENTYLRSSEFKNVKTKEDLKKAALKALTNQELSIEGYDKVTDAVLKEERITQLSTQQEKGAAHTVQLNMVLGESSVVAKKPDEDDNVQS